MLPPDVRRCWVVHSERTIRVEEKDDEGFSLCKREYSSTAITKDSSQLDIYPYVPLEDSIVSPPPSYYPQEH